MLSYLYELIMSFVTLVLGFFGIDMKKKSVSFADEAEKKEEDTEQPAKEETAVVESA
jgi:hypothetical protein